MENLSHRFIKRCYELAEISAQRGESPVGSILVIDNEIIAEATENSRATNDLTCHAEMEAIRAALHHLQTKFLPQATLYTTHEPCVLCAYAIRHYCIAKVVYAQAVGELGSVAGIFPILTALLPNKWGAPPVVEMQPPLQKIS